MIVPDAVGQRRRGLLAHAWVLALTPVYWLLLSLTPGARSFSSFRSAAARHLIHTIEKGLILRFPR